MESHFLYSLITELKFEDSESNKKITLVNAFFFVELTELYKFYNDYDFFNISQHT